MEDFKFLDDQFDGGFIVELGIGRNAWQYWHNNKVITVEVVAGKYQFTELADGKKTVYVFRHQASVIGAVKISNSKTETSKKPA
jgi:hypothetical protein